MCVPLYEYRLRVRNMDVYWLTTYRCLDLSALTLCNNVPTVPDLRAFKLHDFGKVKKSR
jgi:hypothetical protein